MDMIEPAAVICLMEDTKDRHYDPQRALVDAVAAFGTVQSLLAEEVSDAIARAHSTEQALHDAMERVRYWRGELDAVRAAAQSAHATASRHEGHAYVVKNRADGVLAHWQDELNRAAHARNSAQDWVSRAQGELRCARDRVSSAQGEVAAAMGALNACEANVRYDEAGYVIYPDCSGPSAVVFGAQGRLTVAVSMETTAFGNLNAAEAELAQAQAHMDMCADRRDRAAQAVSTAQHAIGVGRRAVQDAAAAICSAEGIYPLVNEMERLLDVTRERADACADQARIARNRADTGMTRFHDARVRAGDNAQDATCADDRLMEKAALMQKFDTRTL